MLRVPTLAVLALAASFVASSRGLCGDDETPESKGAPPLTENRLAKERSPYLRQHRTNPVDWYPWGAEAFARARELDRPIFVSVGYAACHWCHVMERESFEDPATAAVLNATFVCVKVDREERPDVDALTMQTAQLFGRGGWPTTVLLLPDGRPFLGATYLPAANLRELAREIERFRRDDRAPLERQAEHVTERLRAMSAGPDPAPTDADDASLLRLAREAIAARFDPLHAGYGDPRGGFHPKFPPHTELLWTLDDPRAPADALDHARRTLDAIERGGIHDHVAGGFHRYATDRAWVLPHFEKMLYDNALLARAFATAAKRFDEPRYERAARRAFAWMEDVLRRPAGGYASSLDADTDGEEGTTITWTAEELRDALDPDLATVVFDLAAITVEGNVLDEATQRATGRNVLHHAQPLAAVAARRGLDEAEVRRRWDAAMDVLVPLRAKRPQPSLDDKVITAWNGLLVSAFARAGLALGDADLVRRGSDLATYLLAASRREDGTLLRFPRGSGPEIPGFAEDHVHLIEGLLDLEDATGERAWRVAARDLAARLVAGFEDRERGGFWSSAHGVHESLLVRSKEAWDSPIPSDNGTAATTLLRLAERERDRALSEPARRTLAAYRPLLGHAGMAPGLVALYRALALASALDRDEASQGGAADAEGRIDSVRARAWLEREEARRGDAVRVRLDLVLDAGWQIGPLGADTDPTTTHIAFASPIAGLALHDVRELPSPDGGARRFSALMRIAADAWPGPRRLPLRVRVQACDDRGTCLAPAAIELSLPLRVGDAAGPARHAVIFRESNDAAARSSGSGGG